jgi:DNA invertase Pin-like site-specific DNA recombinase
MRIPCPENDQAKRIVGYTRLSTREQQLNSDALGNHIARLKAAGCTEILIDIESRSKADRVELNELLHRIESRLCDEAVFIRLDRITDSHAVLERVITACLDNDVRARGLDDNIDFDTVGGKLHARILVSLSRAEVERLAERVRHGWEHLRSKKVAMNPPFGYRKENDRFVLDHEPFVCLLDGQQVMSRAAIAAEIIADFMRERSLRLALRALNERYGISSFAHNNKAGKAKGGRITRDVLKFSTGGLSLWLKNPVLRGHTAYLRRGENIIHYDTHPNERLLTDVEWTDIQGVFAHNLKLRGGSNTIKYPCSGLVFCGECRAAHYSLKGNRGKTPGYNYYYQCRNWVSRGCSQKKTIRMEIVEAAVIDALVQKAKDIAELGARAPKKKSTKLIELEQELIEIETLEARFKSKRYAQAKQDVLNQIREAKIQEDSGESLDNHRKGFLSIYTTKKQYWQTLTPHQKRTLFHELVEAVTIFDGKVTAIELKV